MMVTNTPSPVGAGAADAHPRMSAVVFCASHGSKQLATIVRGQTASAETSWPAGDLHAGCWMHVE